MSIYEMNRPHTNIIPQCNSKDKKIYLQWALPSSGHPCPWSPPSSWGIGHLCPVWWQRGNCLNVHTTDTHTCFMHAFGLACGASSHTAGYLIFNSVFFL